MKPTLTESIIDALTRIPHGWCSIEKALELADTITSNKMERIVEIGVFAGRSLIPMALACKHQGFGKVVGIDPWQPQASVEGQTGENMTWWSKLDHDAIYAEFLRCVAILGVEPYVDVQRLRSDDFFPIGPIQLLHVDGNHSDQALRDAERYAPLVPVGGYTYLDDLGWQGGGVTRAMYAIQEMGFEKQYDRDTGAMFKRVRNNGLIFP